MRASKIKIAKSSQGLVRVHLNNPARANAVDPEMARELLTLFTELETARDARVVLLSAEGKNFCAGFDLNQAGAIIADPLPLQQLMSNLVAQMRRCPQPIIAMVQGAASGAGFALLLASDVRFATPDAKMNVAMARVGLTGCDMGISYFLPRALGPSIAAELMMTGRFIEAQRAARLGLVSDLVPMEQLQDHAEAIAAEMLLTSPLGLALTKFGLDRALAANSLEEVLASEDRGQVLCIKKHMREGVDAFFQKRAARYVD